MVIVVLPIRRRVALGCGPRPTIEDAAADYARAQLLASYGAGIVLEVPKGKG